jgi:hypothetical protein
LSRSEFDQVALPSADGMNEDLEVRRLIAETGDDSLTREEVRQLLEMAAHLEDGFLLTEIQLRLERAVEGIEIPDQDDDPVAERVDQINRLFVEGVGNRNVVEQGDKIYALIKEYSSRIV